MKSGGKVGKKQGMSLWLCAWIVHCGCSGYETPNTALGCASFRVNAGPSPYDSIHCCKSSKCADGCTWYEVKAGSYCYAGGFLATNTFAFHRP